jgi:hypothetical protein
MYSVFLPRALKSHTWISDIDLCNLNLRVGSRWEWLFNVTYGSCTPKRAHRYPLVGTKTGLNVYGKKHLLSPLEGSSSL